MQRSDEEETDFYFDSLEFLSTNELLKDELTSGRLDYGLWLEEPTSVDERRREFYTKMKMVEDGSAGCVTQLFEFDRNTEYSDAVSSSVDGRRYREQNNSECCSREAYASGANDMVDEIDDMIGEPILGDYAASVEHNMAAARSASEIECGSGKRKAKRWWQFFVSKVKQRREASTSREKKDNHLITDSCRTKVKQIGKKYIEFTGLYEQQQFGAHSGFIWAMKFSPDGQYLATGGEDGVLRVWKIVCIDVSSKSFPSESTCTEEAYSLRKSSSTAKASVIIPSKIFQIEESPLHEFRGHDSDILDISWFNSNLLLSSSTDETARLWKIGCNQCLDVFRHSNYVTCVQFNPVDENMFITGSVDGKVRVWGISEKRVVDWIVAGDVITSISYRPDGDGIVVGSVTGSCRFYRYSGSTLQIEGEIRIRGRKRSSNAITGIQFLQGSSRRVIISCEDSKVRIFDGMDLVQKFKGLSKSGCQMSASLSPGGRHVISVGENSRVYLWNHDEFCYPSSKQKKSVRACEHFFSQDVSLAVPWAGFPPNSNESHHTDLKTYPETAMPPAWEKDCQRFSLSNWFSADAKAKAVTWPEEKLPLWISPDVDGEIADSRCGSFSSQAWGLVIVTAAWDGTIRTYHNYGLPVRL